MNNRIPGYWEAQYAMGALGRNLNLLSPGDQGKKYLCYDLENAQEFSTYSKWRMFGQGTVLRGEKADLKT